MNQLIHIIFIIFIIFLFINIYTKESFTENNEIIDIFRELKMDIPNNKTIDFYVNYMNQNK